MDRIQKRLGVETSKKSVNTDSYLKINLDSEQRLLPPDEISKIVNAGDRFNTERENSSFYRILGTINPTVSNTLFSLSDNLYGDLYTWAGFNYRDPVTHDYRFLDTSYPKDQDLLDKTDVVYSQAINLFLKERDGWFGYFDPDITKSSLCNFFDMEPKRERFSFEPDINPYHAPLSSPVKNWELTITYPHSVDSGHTMVNGGLMIVEAVPVVVATRLMTAFGLPCQHNLSTGDLVRITGTTGYNGEFVVVRTGLDNGDLQPYYFVVDLPPTGTTSNNSRINRLSGGVPSQYYFRKFRKIKTKNGNIIEPDDYETYKLAFSENVFYDNISQFVFNEDIDVGNLSDNLGRPLSELYLTVIKTDSNGLFGNVSSGIETPFIPFLNTSDTNTYLQNIPAINKIHNGGVSPFQSYTPLESDVTITDNNGILNNIDYYGDLVEYNSNEVKETVLANISHRVNVASRETQSHLDYVSALGATATTVSIDLGPRQEGYFYNPHQMIKIRTFSNYIEQGDRFTDGIPSYAVDLGDGRYLWRDLLDIGFNESDVKPLDYPFLNGCHYMYNNYCFYVRRQDPFDNWELYYSKFPADPIGERITDKFTINSSEEVC